MNPLQQLSSEALVEQGISLVKKTAKVVGQQAQATTQTAVSQLTGQTVTPSDHKPAARSEETKSFIKDLYSPTRPKEHDLPSIDDKPHAEMKQQEKSATDQKLADTRQRLAQLHNSQHQSSYFDPTFNRPKQQEEKPVERIEREKQEEMWLEQEKEKKKPKPMAVQMGQSKAEKFPGASG